MENKPTIEEEIVKMLRTSSYKLTSGFPAGLFSVKFK